MRGRSSFEIPIPMSRTSNTTRLRVASARNTTGVLGSAEYLSAFSRRLSMARRISTGSARIAGSESLAEVSKARCGWRCTKRSDRVLAQLRGRDVLQMQRHGGDRRGVVGRPLDL